MAVCFAAQCVIMYLIMTIITNAHESQLNIIKVTIILSRATVAGVKLMLRIKKRMIYSQSRACG